MISGTGTPSGAPLARPASPPTEAGRVVLRLRDVSRSFREGDRLHSVLRGVDLEVCRGELVGLLGPSGSGKSTLLNLIAGIDLPDAGEVEVEGVALQRLMERERTLFRRDHMGFVFQLFNLIPTLTVEENLLLPLELAGRPGAEAQARARVLLEAVGLGDRWESWPDRLSGGEQQRVALARALVHEPAIILADEPTGNLDRHTGDRILELLGRLVRERGTTLVMATHAERAAAQADRTLELVDGRLIERGRPGGPPPAGDVG